MVTIKVNESFVLTFDGKVMEVFYHGSTASKRMHISQIDDIQLQADKKGNHSLNIKNGVTGMMGIEINEAAFPQVAQLCADVLKARAEYRFE
jgi:hypothetical protein